MTEGAGGTFDDGAIQNLLDEIVEAQRETRSPMGFLIKDKGQRDVGLGRNAACHAHRLSEEGRSPQENAFADALETHGPDYKTLFPDARQQDTIASVLSLEGSDTVMWWTLAPYVYAELQSQGVDSREGVRRVLDWASRGSNAALNLTLPGLEVYNQSANAMKTFILSRDPQGPSHRLAAKESRRLVTAGVFPTARPQ